MYIAMMSAMFLQYLVHSMFIYVTYVLFVGLSTNTIESSLFSGYQCLWTHGLLLPTNLRPHERITK